MMNQAEIAIDEYRQHPTDTGSSEVQIAQLSSRVRHLTEHMKANRSDYATQRGLQMLVGKRRRLLDYLRRVDVARYQNLIKRLGLRH